MVDPDETIGIYVRQGDASMIDAFDEFYKTRDGADYSRSARIIEAMQMLLVVDETLDELEWADMAEPSKRHAVRQALFGEDRRS